MSRTAVGGLALRAAYAKAVATRGLQPDAAQQAVLARLVDLQQRLEHDFSLQGRVARWLRWRPTGTPPPTVRGLYLWGPPGRGKTLLLDLFHSTLPVPGRRQHFHHFMRDVHARLAKLRRRPNPLTAVADQIANESRVICFDELQVTDIADAMILGRLFEALFERRVVLAVTSNRAPEALYANGINRELFLPFIAVLRDRCQVVELTGERDWRLDRMKGRRTWLAPADDGARAEFEAFWRELRGEAPEAAAHLTVKGREVTIARTAGGLARATFAELCARPLGASDYLALAERFHTLFLEDVPVLGPHNHHEARRLVTLIDALYEARTRLVVLAEAEPERLYPEGVGAFEFERTVSRLNQMSGAQWLERADAT